jgi:hypothetical protein
MQSSKGFTDLTMIGSGLSAIRYAVCAIGWVSVAMGDYYANPKRSKFDIFGTGFLVTRRGIVTCAHVIDALEQIRRKRGRKPFARCVQFVHPPRPGTDADVSTSVRAFTVRHKDDRIDVAVLETDGSDLPFGPVVIIGEDYAPSIGERVGLCGYAHGSTLLARAGEVYRFGPLVQTGVIAALAPFELTQPEAALLDLVTGPAASGSPVFRWETGEVIGILVEGQIKGSAALSTARLIYRDARGQFTARAARVELGRVLRG